MTINQQTLSFTGSEPIALIGIGCKLPGNIANSDDLLKALREGRDLITEIPKDRWNVDAYYDPDPLAPGKTYVRKGGFIEGIEHFDAGFFGISDAEASRMDPQQRLVLQTVWHALEDANIPAEELMQSNTGLYLAMMNTNGYSQLKGVYEGPLGITAYDAMGDAMSIAGGRISHFLGLEGPCLTLDTACSSSLVALHLARQSILSGESDTAIVAGVNAILHPGIHIAFSKVGLMSRAGRCATFDASADGYIRGEGCVAVVLRRQSQAIARGDRIIASIVGTAVNQDGHTPAVTAPNGQAQEKVIRSALARTGVEPNDIDYVEAHGTGTPVGDPIEMSAIVNVYGPGRKANQPLYVGSVKSNFGHIEAGAGLLGLAKAALSLANEEILPSIHFEKLNPNIDLGPAPIRVATERVAWPRNGKARLAGVNSFGYSGTNAHAILQEAPAVNDPQSAFSAERSLFEQDGGLLLISAKSPASLDELVDHWIEYLDDRNTIPLRDIAFTAALGRTQLNHRLALVAGDKNEIKQKLQSWREGRTPKGLAVGQIFSRVKPKLTFMFTGQGAQYAHMGQELYEREAHFAQAIDQIALLMNPELGVPLHEVLFGEKSAEYLENTRYVQPALFAIEYALAELFRSWGLEPDYLIGHSVGEIVAACISGILDLEDAARFVVVRGKLMGQLPAGGKMLAIGASLEQVQRWVQGREADVSIATVNGPHSVVVSGTAEAVQAVEELAQAAGRQTKELEVSHAFHSPLMDPILAELSQAAASMHISRPRIPIISNTTGDFYQDKPSPEYWSDHVRQAVLFHQGMEKIVAAGSTLLVEIGPHPALIPAVAAAFNVPTLQAIPTLKRDKKDAANLLGCLASLNVNGAALKLDRLFWSPVYHRVSLPQYPFQRIKYWLKPNGALDQSPEAFYVMAKPAEAKELPKLPELHPLLGKVITYNHSKAVFESGFKTSSPWTDHRVLESTVFPGTAFLEMAARGFAAISGVDWRAVVLTDVTFERPLLLSYREEKRVRLSLEHSSNGTRSTKFTISAANDVDLPYCRGKIAATSEKPGRSDLKVELDGRNSEMKVIQFYGELRNRGLEYGARFANVRELWLGAPGSGEAFGRVALTPAISTTGKEPFNNAILLDGCLHVFGAALGTVNGFNTSGAFVPASLQSISLWSELPSQVWCRIKVDPNRDGNAALASVRVLDDGGNQLVEFKNLELRRTLSLAPGHQTGLASRPQNAVLANPEFQSRDNLVGHLLPFSRKERIAEISKWLTAEIKDTMGQAAEGLNLENLPPSAAFLEIGLDSLLVTELQRRIQEKLAFRFKPMQGLDYQSIETMAEYILDDVLAAQLSPKLGTETAGNVN